MRLWISLGGAGFLALAAAALPAAGGADDAWATWAELDTIEVLTENPDGSSEETKIWIVVHEGAAFIRTSDRSPWGDNVERAQTIGIRSEEQTLTVRPTAITDSAQREAVIAAFRAKYGFFDGLINFVRGDARIWSLAAEAP